MPPKKKLTDKPPVRARVPLCPRCGNDTVLRRSKLGEFFGCSTYPLCKGVVDIALAGEAAHKAADILRRAGGIADWSKTISQGGHQVPVQAVLPLDPNAIPLMVGSPEQEAIWKELLEGSTHVVVEALAGTGKTTSMTQACMRLPRTLSIAFVAFNKHIAVEAGNKLRASGCTNVTCSTYHSLGLRCIKAIYPNTRITEYKTEDILETYSVPPLMELWQWRQVKSLVSKLVGFAKNYLLDDTYPNFREKLEALADHHSVDLNGIGQNALEYVPRVLADSRACIYTSIDFDDMVWLPVVLKLQPPMTFDMLIVDEFQDSNACQQELALQLCPKGRIVVIGDRFQAIYAFRGAGVSSIPDMIVRLDATARRVTVLPLTVTRRCPKSHVAIAQSIVPQFQALEDAPEGEVLTCSESQAIDKMQPGDLVLCRCNAPLIPTAYALLRRGVKAAIRGRDIGKGLIQLIEKLERTSADLLALTQALRVYKYDELTRLAPLGDKATGRISVLMDKCDCLEEMISGAKSIAELKGSIESLFADFEADGKPKEAVVLGTVHRTKGLEGDRMFILKPELIPHPMAKKIWEHAGELNLAYVAVTRAKFSKDKPGTLVFCGAIPGIFKTKESQDA